MSFSLLQLSQSELEALAASRIPDGLEGRFEEDALPPAFVASRSLEFAAAGFAAPWSTTFLIANDDDARIVGGCDFKTVPDRGRVEIGYAVSPTMRGKGVATVAIKMLVQKAFEAGASEVLAEILPSNIASIRVVQKLGFEEIGSRFAEDDELVMLWVRRSDVLVDVLGK